MSKDLLKCCVCGEEMWSSKSEWRELYELQENKHVCGKCDYRYMRRLIAAMFNSGVVKRPETEREQYERLKAKFEGELDCGNK